MTDRVEVEECVVGTLIMHPEWLDDAKVDRGMFSDEVCARLFKTVLDMVANGKAVDRLAVGVEASVNRGTLTNFTRQTANDLKTFKGWIAILADEANRSRLSLAADKIADLANEKDVSSAVRKAEEFVFNLSVINENQEAKPVNTILFDWLDVLEASGSGSEFGYETGYGELSDIVGPLAPGNYYVVAGRPSMGKTTLAINIGLNVIREHEIPICMFSLEMTKEQIAKRVASNICHMDHQIFASNKLSTEGVQAVRTAFKKMNNIFYVDTHADTIADITFAARRYIRKFGVKLLILDYLQLIRPGGRTYGNKVAEVTEVSNGVKKLARELNVPVIVLSQLSRAVEQREDKRPVLSDLRESGAIEQDADAVVLMFRPQYYDGNRSGPGACELDVAKNRHGVTDTTGLTFHPKYCMFTEETRQGRHDEINVCPRRAGRDAGEGQGVGRDAGEGQGVHAGGRKGVLGGWD